MCVCTRATWPSASVQITVARFSFPHAVARAQVLPGTEALSGITRRTNQKEGCRNGRRLSSAFAFAAVVASFVVSVGLLSTEGLEFNLQRLRNRVFYGASCDMLGETTWKICSRLTLTCGLTFCPRLAWGRPSEEGREPKRHQV